MSDDDDYVGQDADAAEADDAPEPERDPSADFESGGPSVQQHARIPRGTAADRKAMEEAIARFKSEKTTTADEDHGDFGGDYEDTGTPKKPATRPAPAAFAAPPPLQVPSLDPEIQRMRQAIADRQADLDRRAAEVDKARDSIQTVADYETYLESAPKAYRSWMEAMRGSALTDDEFKQEAADFITMMSGDVLGVELPVDVRSAIESKLGRKALAAYKQKEQRTKERETKAQEQARVESEWKQAAVAVDRQLQDPKTAEAYPWLAAEPSPGHIVIDVIQSAQRRDGTSLSWMEASKIANDLLKKQVSDAFDRRKHLLSAAPATPGDAARTQASAPGRPPGPSQVQRSPELQAPSAPRPGKGWDKEAHRRQTRAAFAASFKPEE